MLNEKLQEKLDYILENIHKSTPIVIKGKPQTGKTTLLKALKSDGYTVFEDWEAYEVEL